MAFVGTATADPSPFCGKTGASDWAEVVEAFVGQWSIEHQAGYALMGTMVLPFAYLKATLEAIAAGHPQNRIDDLLPWNFTPSS